jgi:hypothetical protein
MTEAKNDEHESDEGAGGQKIAQQWRYSARLPVIGSGTTLACRPCPRFR